MTVLPGSFVARDAHGANPGRRRIRLALVANQDECAEAVDRIVAFTRRLAADARRRPAPASGALRRRPRTLRSPGSPHRAARLPRMPRHDYRSRPHRASPASARDAAPRLRRALADASLLLAAINTGIAAVLWIDDTRPFWHPLLTVAALRLLDRVLRQRRDAVGQARPILRLVVAVLIGTLHRRRADDPRQGLLARTTSRERADVRSPGTCSPPSSTACSSASFFYVKHREARAAAALHKAEAERHLLSKQAIEAELKLMQAQVEPHFLFNTLASVQYLTETDPPQASGCSAT